MSQVVRYTDFVVVYRIIGTMSYTVVLVDDAYYALSRAYVGYLFILCGDLLCNHNSSLEPRWFGGAMTPQPPPFIYYSFIIHQIVIARPPAWTESD